MLLWPLLDSWLGIDTLFLNQSSAAKNLWAGLYDSDSSTDPELLCCYRTAAAAAAYFCSLFTHS